MKNLLLTEETRFELLKLTELKIAEVTKAIDNARNLLNSIEKTRLLMMDKNINIEIKNLTNLLKYRLFIGLLILDTASAMRVYLNAKLPYEELFSARQIIVIINEGYKKIYNFVAKNDSGDLITKYRNKSFWVKDIGTIINNDLPNLQDEYNLLTKDLEEYLNFNFDEIKKQRDLSIHYDNNAEQVYDMLLKLDIDKTYKKLIPFLKILYRMFDLTHLLAMGYQEKSKSERMNLELKFQLVINQLEDFKNSENREKISELQENIKNSVKRFLG